MILHQDILFPQLEFSQYAILLPNLSLMLPDKLSGFRSNSGHFIQLQALFGFGYFQM